MDIQAYLERIQYQKEIKVSKNVLFDLQEAHLRSVPFENLDIHYHKNIELDAESFFTKIVTNKRGGFCYELNGLFHQLLKAIGFDVKMVSGRVCSKDGIYGEEFDHLAIVASINKQLFLVDAGFGKFALNPLEIKIDVPIVDSFGTFQFDRHESNYLCINELQKGQAVPQYIFSIKERELSEFEGMCTYHQQSKESHFTQKKVISIVTPNGRTTLTNNLLKITAGEREEEILVEDKQFDFYLKKYFNIEL